GLWGVIKGFSTNESHPMSRRTLVALLIAVALVCAVAASLAIGAAQIPLRTVWEALTSYDATNPEHIAVVEKRIPRTVVGVVVGAALGLAGTVAQGVTRNPLADLGILGINQGAALGVVSGIILVGATAPAQYMWFGVVGAGAATILVWFLASRGREGATPVKLALAGAAIAASFSSVVSGILISDDQALDSMRFWQVGSLAGRGYDVLFPALPLFVVGGVLALAVGRSLNLLALGDDTAHGLGLNTGRARVLSGVVIAVLGGAATAVAGPIAFLGLVVPHAVRAFAGPDYRWILAFSAPVAAVVILVSDVLARVVARPGELQVGIVLAVIGAPVFIAIIRRGKAATL
ncbi:FecCD family ABC transporter permease, partial [Timonella senegalensis]|uniref:FecCD family ABC transporter permease n=1 Tax=Timonella senegalensis TaxID=1465825 RepID=UPI001E4A9047